MPQRCGALLQGCSRFHALLPCVHDDRAHDFEADDLVAFVRVLSANIEHVYKHLGKLGVVNAIGTKLQAIYHALRANTVEGSRRNIQEHYDLGNGMYKLFLDASMTYSSGIYLSGQDSLHDAQLHKLDEIIRKADIQPTDHILEIGCGWGSFAIRAASTVPGCRVTGITISTEQLAEARARVKAAGLEDKVNLIMQDYRLLDAAAHGAADGFDKIVSPLNSCA